jgi:hypothetical protein
MVGRFSQAAYGIGWRLRWLADEALGVGDVRVLTGADRVGKSSSGPLRPGSVSRFESNESGASSLNA